MSHWCSLLWMCSTRKAKSKDNCQVPIQANSANAVIRSPRIWEVPGILYIMFSVIFTYLQAPSSGEEEVSQGPGVCAVRSHGMKRRTLPKMLAKARDGRRKCWTIMAQCAGQRCYPAAISLTVFRIHSGYIPVTQFYSACSTGWWAQRWSAKWCHTCLSTNLNST